MCMYMHMYMCMSMYQGRRFRYVCGLMKGASAEY